MKVYLIFAHFTVRNSQIPRFRYFPAKIARRQFAKWPHVSKRRCRARVCVCRIFAMPPECQLPPPPPPRATAAARVHGLHIQVCRVCVTTSETVAHFAVITEWFPWTRRRHRIVSYSAGRDDVGNPAEVIGRRLGITEGGLFRFWWNSEEALEDQIRSTKHTHSHIVFWDQIVWGANFQNIHTG